MTKIKICGLMHECDIEYVNHFKPDYIGFILAKGFRRSIDFERAKKLKEKLDPDIKAVGVFVNDSIEDIDYYVKNNIIDVIQLHGSEDNAFIEKLKKLTNKTIIKAFRINQAQDITTANDSKADEVLLDSGTGTGKSFNWELLKSINRRYFLAGGIGIDNVRQAVKDFSPYCVDVSSKVETDGVKDKEKIKQFIDTVRSIV